MDWKATFAEQRTVDGLGTFSYENGMLWREGPCRQPAAPEDYEMLLAHFAQLASLPEALPPAAEVTFAWQLSPEEYGQREMSKLQEQLRQECAAQAARKARDPEAPWGKDKTFSSKKHMLDAYEKHMADLRPEQWAFDHQREVAQAMRQGQAVPGAVLALYPHLQRLPLPLAPLESASDRILVEFRTLPKVDENTTFAASPVEGRAVLVGPDGEQVELPWQTLPSGASGEPDSALLRQRAVIEFGRRLLLRSPPTPELRALFSETLHPYVIPAGRPGVVALAGTRQYAIRPVPLAAGLEYALFGREASGSWERVADFPASVNYDDACRTLGSSGLLDETACRADGVVDQAWQDSREPDATTQLRSRTRAFYTDLYERVAKLRPDGKGRVAIKRTEGPSDEVPAVFFGHYAIHETVETGQDGWDVTVAANGLKAVTLPEKRDALALTWLLNQVGIDPGQSDRASRKRLQQLIVAFQARQLPPEEIPGHEMVQMLLFE